MRRENDNTFYKKVVALATKILPMKKFKKKLKKVLTQHSSCGRIKNVLGNRETKKHIEK